STARISHRAVAHPSDEGLLARSRGEMAVHRVEHPVPLHHLAGVSEVDLRKLELLARDVVPHVQLGPVGEREDADRLSGMDSRVVEAPQLRPLVAGIPLAELVPEAEDALLGPCLLLVTAGAAQESVAAGHLQPGP